MMRRHPRILVAALLTLLGVSLLASRSTADAQTGRQVEQRALLDAVERFLSERYANFPDRVADLSIDLPALHARTDSALQQARNGAEVKRALEEMLGTFRDGHLQVRTLRPSTTSDPSGSQDEAVPARSDARSVCRSWGYGSARSRSSFQRLDGYRSLPRVGLPFERGVIERGGQSFAILRIDSFGLEPHASTCTTVWRGWQEQTTSTHCDGSCAETLRAQIASTLADSLRAALVQLANTNAATLVIDLTGNGGGTEWVSRAVRAISTSRVPPTRVAVVATAGQTACEPLRAWRDSAARPCDYRVSRSLDSSDASLNATGPWSRRIVIVMDGGTASAAEQFAANLIDHAGAQSIGARTYGSGCGYTSSNRPLALVEARLEILAPNCSRFRKDGSNEVNGIAPMLDAGWSGNDNPARRAELVLRRLSGI
jgi:hypothetical protein